MLSGTRCFNVINYVQQAQIHDLHSRFFQQNEIQYDTGCLRKRYGVADYQHFKNGNTQQCNNFRPYNIFRHYKYNFYIAVCAYVKHNFSYERESKRNAGSNGTQTNDKKKQTNFIIQILFDPTSLFRLYLQLRLTYGVEISHTTRRKQYLSYLKILHWLYCTT